MEIPPGIKEAAEEAAKNLLTQKSKELYVNAYESFKKWKQLHESCETSEAAMLVYFTELSTKYKPSSLWTIYSMLKNTINKIERINIETYSLLITFLRQKSEGYSPTKANAFTAPNIIKFLNEAPDTQFLPIKVALLMGVLGSCHSKDMYEMKVSDVQDHGSVMVVYIPKSEARTPRKFTIPENFYSICRKYLSGRTPADSEYVFHQYRFGKITKQRIGKNSFIHMGKKIATFLKLDDPDSYTGHSLRRSSLVADALLDASSNLGYSKQVCIPNLPQASIHNTAERSHILSEAAVSSDDSMDFEDNNITFDSRDTLEQSSFDTRNNGEINAFSTIAQHSNNHAREIKTLNFNLSNDANTIPHMTFENCTVIININTK